MSATVASRHQEPVPERPGDDAANHGGFTGRGGVGGSGSVPIPGLFAMPVSALAGGLRGRGGHRHPGHPRHRPALARQPRLRVHQEVGRADDGLAGLARPLRTSTRSSDRAPSTTSRGTSIPVESRTKTRLRSPVIITASRGTASTSRPTGASKYIVANIPGRSLKPGFGAVTPHPPGPARRVHRGIDEAHPPHEVLAGIGVQLEVRARAHVHELEILLEHVPLDPHRPEVRQAVELHPRHDALALHDVLGQHHAVERGDQGQRLGHLARPLDPRDLVLGDVPVRQGAGAPTAASRRRSARRRRWRSPPRPRAAWPSAAPARRRPASGCTA